MFHRETDAAKVARNRDALFDLHAAALAGSRTTPRSSIRSASSTSSPIPSFQFGGMEHAGAISTTRRVCCSTNRRRRTRCSDRASVIAHETAHMWFGDLVTMRWFNDVWMKEVFANFMAAKIVNPSFPQVNHELRFLLAHYPAAYQVDRTAGTNADPAGAGEPRRSRPAVRPHHLPEGADRDAAARNLIVGERRFRDGLRDYLKRYRSGMRRGSISFASSMRTPRTSPPGAAPGSKIAAVLSSRPRCARDSRGGSRRLTLQPAIR